jgi:hypothetical protein
VASSQEEGSDNSYSEDEYEKENHDFMQAQIESIVKHPTETNVRLLRGVISVTNTNQADQIAE